MRRTGAPPKRRRRPGGTDDGPDRRSVIRRSSYGSARMREDLPRLVALYPAARLRIDELITWRYGLDDANEARRALASGELTWGPIAF